MRISDWSSDVCSSDLPRIARRFSVVGDRYKFKVYINEKEVTTRDRGYHSDLQFWWDLDGQTRTDQLPLATSLASDEKGSKCVARLGDMVVHEDQVYRLRGFIATVAKTKRTEAHTSELQSLMRITYAVFCLQQKT